MQIINIAVTKTCAFQHVSYNLERRTLLTWLNGHTQCDELAGVPFELARSFPTGITALTYYMMYLKGRFPCEQLSFKEAQERDPSFEPPQPPVPVVPLSERLAEEQRRWLLAQGRDPAKEAAAEKLRFEQQAAEPPKPIERKPRAAQPKRKPQPGGP